VEVVTGAQIRAARALISMKQAELAKDSGLSVGVIRNIEAGSSDPRASTLRAIEEAFRRAGVAFLDEGQDSRDGGYGVRLLRRGRSA
jgi:transcriptional regulator with XRE-family HTH domain